MRRKDPAKFRATIRRAWAETPASMRNADHLGGYYGISTATARQWMRDAGIR